MALMTSCSIDDGANDNLQLEFIPIDSVDIPDEFNFGESHTITVYYMRPSTCHSFSNFQYIAEANNVRTVAVVNLVTQGADCETLTNTVVSETFNFNVLDTEPFTFNFWQGKDPAGQDIYLTYEIPVNQ